MASFKMGAIWWHKFYFAGQEIRESSKSTLKTVAKAAEQQRRHELEGRERSRRRNDHGDRRSSRPTDAPSLQSHSHES
jgi:hypothetical protein